MGKESSEFEYLDYFGSPVEVGDRGIRIDVNHPHRPFKQFKVVELNSDRSYYAHIGILIEDGQKKSWCTSHQVITEKSFAKGLPWNLNSRFKLKKPK